MQVPVQVFTFTIQKRRWMSSLMLLKLLLIFSRLNTSAVQFVSAPFLPVSSLPCLGWCIDIIRVKRKTSKVYIYSNYLLPFWAPFDEMKKRVQATFLTSIHMRTSLRPLCSKKRACFCINYIQLISILCHVDYMHDSTDALVHLCTWLPLVLWLGQY